MTLLVAPVGSKAARYAVETWHYSRTMPVGRSVYFGVWEDEQYIGAVIFGRGASPALGKAYGLNVMQVCELTRVALREHVAPVSQIVAVALDVLRRQSPGLRLVVSFADPVQGHHGGIYQAGNWLYLGTSAPSHLWRVRATGELLHQRMVSATGALRQFGRVTRSRRIDECDRIEVPGKHRYVMPLDRAMRRQLAKRALPYPQDTRGQGLSGELAPSQGAGSGSIPDDRSTSVSPAL